MNSRRSSRRKVGTCSADHVIRPQKKPNAGVGAAARDGSNVVIVQAERKTGAFQIAWNAGRAEKYEIDLGWEANVTIYVIYGKSEGSTKD